MLMKLIRRIVKSSHLSKDEMETWEELTYKPIPERNKFTEYERFQEPPKSS